jgi:hypothetical protein
MAPMRAHRSPAVFALAALVTGCASTQCAPVSVVVAQKEERSQLRTEVRGMRTSGTGAVVEDRRDVIVHEFWVRGTDGQWYQVGEPQWRAVEPGATLSLCP